MENADKDGLPTAVFEVPVLETIHPWLVSKYCRGLVYLLVLIGCGVSSFGCFFFRKATSCSATWSFGFGFGFWIFIGGFVFLFF